jgi:hypothetical protein
MMATKNVFMFFCSKGAFKSFFNYKKPYRSHKLLKSRVFLMLDDRRIPDPDPNLDPHLFLMDPDPGGPKIYGSGSETQFYRSLVWQIQLMYMY